MSMNDGRYMQQPPPCMMPNDPNGMHMQGQPPSPPQGQQQQQPVQGHRRRQRSKYDKTKNTVPGEPKENKNSESVEKISIEEALKALTMTPEGAGSAMKTPVSVLQELLSRRGITPTYDLVQIEGAIHEPTFRYRVAFADKDAMGAGRSKKEAKHQAARNLIDQLLDISSVRSEQICMNPIGENGYNSE